MPPAKRSSGLKRGNPKQRKTQGGANGASDEYDAKSLFTKMAKECGVILKNGKSANIIKKDQYTFLKDFLKAIKSHDDYPDVIEDILEGVRKYADDEQRFIRMMLNTALEESSLMESTPQEGVMLLLLKTEPLQTGTVNLLIEKLNNYKENSSVRVEGEESMINAPQLILNQLRWLDVVDNAGAIVVKLLNIAPAMSHQSACAIISCVPEIVGSEAVPDSVTAKLKELLASDVELTIAILDTLGCLNCSAEAMEDVKSTIFSSLYSVKIEELPVVVKFLLQTMNSVNSERNIACLRQYLTFSPGTLSQNMRSSADKHKEGSEVTCIRLTAEAILFAAQYQPLVAETWIKVLKNLKESDFTSTDLVTLIILCANYNAASKKSAVSVMKSKLLSSVVSDALIQSAIEECSDVLVLYFSTLSDLASKLVSSSGTSLQHAGSVFYSCMFSNMDHYCRQKVVGCLIEHVGSCSASEVDAALSILKDLAVKNLSLLTPFTLFILAIMDRIGRMTSHQVRLVYDVLNQLAFGKATKKATTIEDEIRMLLRKQLTHSLPAFRRIGVIGAVSMLRILGDEANWTEEGQVIVMSMLSLLEDATSRCNKTRSYYLDELCRLFCSGVNPRISESLREMLDKEMSEKFLNLKTKNKAALQEDSSIKAMFSIENRNGTEIPIYSSIQASDSRHFLLCPLFKALGKTIELSSDIITLASSSVALKYSAYDVKNFKILALTEQIMVLDSLFVALNLFREHISALSRKKSGYGAAMERINHIIKLEGIIESLTAATGKYSPPIMVTEFNETSSLPRVEAGTSSSSTQEEESVMNTSIHSTNGTATAEDPASGKAKKPSKSSKKKPAAAFTMDALKPQYLRELNASTLNLLAVPMGEEVFENEANTVTCNSERCQLFPRQLLYLLRDLKRKVCFKMPSHEGEKKSSPFAAATTGLGFSDLGQIAEIDFGRKVCDLLPCLCNHLESVSTPFQSEDNIEELEVEQRNLLISCYENILEVSYHIISWRGAKRDAPTLRALLFGIGKRLSSDLSETPSLQILSKAAFSYLKNFEITATKVSLHSAVNLAKVLHAVSCFEEVEDEGGCTLGLHDFAVSMLKADWFSSCEQSTISAGKKNELLAYLTKLALRTSNNVIKMATDFVDHGLCKIGRDTEAVPYPCFHKTNAHVLFSCLLEILMEESGKITGIKPTDDESAIIALLLRWNDCMRVVGVLAKLLREFHSKPNILSSLKCGRTLIENFLRDGMPTCEKMFPLYQDDVVSTLKHLQTFTRQLQHLTCHSKVTKDISLAKQVPPLKKSLETLLFRVKAMLALHDCQEAFWLGNLKNRNIQGEEILSQLTQQENPEEDCADASCEYQDMSYSESY